MTDRKDVGLGRYYILRLYLTISGLWPYHRLRDRCICFVPIFVFTFSIVIPQALYLLVGSITFDNVFEVMPSIFVSISMSFKLLVIMLNSEKVKTCLNIMQKDWMSLETDVEKSILQRHTKYGRYLTAFYAGLLHGTACLILLKSIAQTLTADGISNATESSVSFVPPFHLEYGEKFSQYIYLIVVHSYGAAIAHSLSTVAGDGLYYTLIQHACGMFTIIGNKLENIGQNNADDFDAKPDKTKDENYSKALHCLRRHLVVIEFAKHIESLYTKIFLMDLNLSLIGGSLVGMQIMMNLNKGVGDIAEAINLYIAQLVNLFFHFWQAQFLLDYSILPYESICRANWYYTSQRCRKLLLLMMCGTVRPCKITAGKIVILSIDSFAVVMKTSMSYFIVLRSMQ